MQTHRRQGLEPALVPLARPSPQLRHPRPHPCRPRAHRWLARLDGRHGQPLGCLTTLPTQ
eukprot:scaffold155529_cov28-Tisochrysis_lutea.AAC.2